MFEDVKDVSESSNLPVVQHLEPFMRELHVQIHSATVPRSDNAGLADPYITVRCGMYDGMCSWTAGLCVGVCTSSRDTIIVGSLSRTCLCWLLLRSQL